jgi:hypothetical protein
MARANPVADFKLNVEKYAKDATTTARALTASRIRTQKQDESWVIWSYKN